MATTQYTMNPGDNLTAVVQATGTAITSGLQLTVDTTKFTSKIPLVLALEQLTNYISEQSFPL